MKTFAMFILIDIILFGLSDQDIYKENKGLLLITSLIYYFSFVKHTQFFFPCRKKASYYKRAPVYPTISSICYFNSMSFQIIHHVKCTESEYGQDFK